MCIIGVCMCKWCDVVNDLREQPRRVIFCVLEGSLRFSLVGKSVISTLFIEGMDHLYMQLIKQRWISQWSCPWIFMWWQVCTKSRKWFTLSTLSHKSFNSHNCARFRTKRHHKLAQCELVCPIAWCGTYAFFINFLTCWNPPMHDNM